MLGSDENQKSDVTNKLYFFPQNNAISTNILLSLVLSVSIAIGEELNNLIVNRYDFVTIFEFF